VKEYKLFRFIENANRNLVFMNTVEDLYYFIDNIYEEISKIEGEKFSVLVDLFLQNGFSFNRFVMINFDNKNKYKTFIINTQEVSETIKQQIRHYLKSNEELLLESALDKNTIEFVKQAI